MKALLLAGLAASTLTFASFTPAAAEGGCGPFAHRGWDGFCHPNYRPYGFAGYGYGYGWHRAVEYGYGWHRPWGGYGGWHHGW